MFSAVSLAPLVGKYDRCGHSAGASVALLRNQWPFSFIVVDGRLEKELQYTKESLGEGHEKTN